MGIILHMLTRACDRGIIVHTGARGIMVHTGDAVGVVYIYICVDGYHNTHAQPGML